MRVGNGKIRPICKRCHSIEQKERRKSKGSVTKEQAAAEVQKLVEAKQLFQCKTCEQHLLADQFYYRRDYGKVYIPTKRCKSCEKYYQLDRAFSVDSDYYQELLDSQGNCCAICKIDLQTYAKIGYRNYFAVDHCHRTNQVRGLLCDKCNRGLGFFNDDINNLLAAIHYLKEHDIV